MNDVARIRNGLNIRRPKKKANMLNDKRIKACMSRFSSGAYTRMQFLSAVSHAMGAHTDKLYSHYITLFLSFDTLWLLFVVIICRK